jgi:FKBP-type peptidyl-prolyl cis-trans isomerase
MMLGVLACGRSFKAQDADAAKAPELAASLEIDTTALKTTASGLRILDVKVGDGAVAEPGKEVTVHYTLYQASGEKTESSRDGEEPFKFNLGSGQVIGGWEEGVAGMKVGGRRKLVVPPDLAYGDATLVFDIELFDVQ